MTQRADTLAGIVAPIAAAAETALRLARADNLTGTRHTLEAIARAAESTARALHSFEALAVVTDRGIERDGR